MKKPRLTGSPDRDFPYQVDVPVFKDGFAERLTAMHAFHVQRGIQVNRVPNRIQSKHDLIRWCFADVITAEAFKAEFGGTEPMPGDDPIALIRWGKRNIQS